MLVLSKKKVVSLFLCVFVTLEQKLFENFSDSKIISFIVVCYSFQDFLIRTQTRGKGFPLPPI